MDGTRNSDQEFLSEMQRAEQVLDYGELSEKYEKTLESLEQFKVEMKKWVGDKDLLPHGSHEQIEAAIEEELENGSVSGDELVDTIKKMFSEYQEIAGPTVGGIAELFRYVDSLPADKRSAGQARLIELNDKFRSDEYLARHRWLLQQGIRQAREPEEKDDPDEPKKM